MKQVDQGAAIAWLESRLGESRLEAALRGGLDRLTQACVVGLPDAAGELDDASCGLASREGDAALAEWLAGWAAQGRHTVVVLDDMARRGDPVVADEDVAYSGDRVLSYAPIDTAGVEAAATVRRGGSGYPTLAWVLAGVPDDLGLGPQRELDDARADALVDDAVAVVVSVHDAETWLVLSGAEADEGRGVGAGAAGSSAASGVQRRSTNSRMPFSNRSKRGS